MTSEKVVGPKYIRLVKLVTKFLLTKCPIGKNIFIQDKKKYKFGQVRTQLEF